MVENSLLGEHKHASCMGAERKTSFLQTLEHGFRHNQIHSMISKNHSSNCPHHHFQQGKQYCKAKEKPGKWYQPDWKAQCLSPLHPVHEHFWQEERCPKQDCSGQCCFHNSLQGESKTSVVKRVLWAASNIACFPEYFADLHSGV